MAVPKKSPNRLCAWLRRQSERNGKWAECMLRVRYDGGGGDATTLFEAGAAGLGVDVEQATELIQAAQDDCDGRGTQGIYVVELVTSEGRTVGTHTLRLFPEDNDHTDTLMEAGDLRGVVQLLMRHAEAANALNARLVMQQAERMDKILAAQGMVIDLLTRKLETADTNGDAAARADVEKVAVIAEAIVQVVPALAPAWSALKAAQAVAPAPATSAGAAEGKG